METDEMEQGAIYGTREVYGATERIFTSLIAPSGGSPSWGRRRRASTLKFDPAGETTGNRPHRLHFKSDMHDCSRAQVFRSRMGWSSLVSDPKAFWSARLRFRHRRLSRRDGFMQRPVELP